MYVRLYKCSLIIQYILNCYTWSTVGHTDFTLTVAAIDANESYGNSEENKLFLWLNYLKSFFLHQQFGLIKVKFFLKIVPLIFSTPIDSAKKVNILKPSNNDGTYKKSLKKHLKHDITQLNIVKRVPTLISQSVLSEIMNAVITKTHFLFSTVEAIT